MTSSPNHTIVQSSSRFPQSLWRNPPFGLIEISALATLLGAQSAEQLVLGARGVAGLPWASMSIFGLIHSIRACLGAACPDGTREAFGLRSAAIDRVLGMEVPISHSLSEKALSDGGVVRGIWMKQEETLGDHSSITEKSSNRILSEKPKEAVHTIHAFDRLTASISSRMSTESVGDQLRLHYFVPGKVPGNGTMRITALLIFTLLKLFETYTLWRLGATYIWWASALPWLHGLVFATLLGSTGLSTDKPGASRRNIVIGQLPTALSAGGTGDIIIGLPSSVQRHYLWTGFWASGACLYSMVLVAVFSHLTYATLPSFVASAWFSFQILWLTLRMGIYRFAPTDKTPEGVIVPVPWDVADVTLRQQTIELMTGVSHQLITTHPRGPAAYTEDLVDVMEIRQLLHSVNNKTTLALPREIREIAATCEIIGVVGDATLRGIGWVKSKVDTQEMYDCALVFLRAQGKVYVIPSVRVLAGIPPSEIGRYDPRGTRNDGVNIKWIYWIPVDSGIRGQRPSWIEYRGLKVLNGKYQSVDVLEGSELHEVLSGGTINIGFSTESEVLRALEVSRAAAEALLELYSESELLLN